MDVNHSSMKELMTLASSLEAMLILFREASLWLMVCAEALNETIKSGGGSSLRVCS